MKRIALILGALAAVVTILAFVLSLSSGHHSKERTFTGAVRDASSGLPINGANALISDEGHMTQSFPTDQNGVFSFKVESTQHSLAIYVTATGYKPVLVNANPEREGPEAIVMTSLPPVAGMGTSAEVEPSARFASQSAKERETRRLEGIYTLAHPDTLDVAAMSHYVNEHLAQEGAGFVVTIKPTTTQGQSLHIGGGFRVSGYGNRLTANTVNNYSQPEHASH